MTDPHVDPIADEIKLSQGGCNTKFVVTDGECEGAKVYCGHVCGHGVHLCHKCELETLRAEVAQARSTAEYWKAEHLAGNEVIAQLRAQLAAAMVWEKVAEADLKDGEEVIALSPSGNWYEIKYLQGKFLTLGGPALFSVVAILRIKLPGEQQ